ncbi:hypothetical protein Tco_1314969 [Tanacetum coccineum]
MESFKVNRFSTVVEKKESRTILQLEHSLSTSLACVEYSLGKRELEMFKRGADLFVCAIMPNNGSTQIRTTPDNLNGVQVLGGTIRVDHVAKYKKKEGDEEEEQHKREERGVCRASQIGECTRGAG